MIFGSLENFQKTWVKQGLYLYQNQIKIILKLLTIDLLLWQVVYVKQWRKWLMIGWFGSWNQTSCLQNIKLDSEKITVQMIIWFVWNHLFVMPLLEHVVAVLFDLEKAYDTTSKHGIMKDLHKLGLKGRLPLFIQKFLSDRTFNVRIGNTLSDISKQEQGVP